MLTQMCDHDLELLSWPQQDRQNNKIRQTESQEDLLLLRLLVMKISIAPCQEYGISW